MHARSRHQVAASGASGPTEVPPPRPAPDPGPAPGPAVLPPAPVITTHWERDPFERLLQRRAVFLRGALEGATADALAAQLLTLDADSPEPIHLVIDARGDDAFAPFAVTDLIAALRAPVDTTCVGLAAGGAALLLAVGTGTRRAGPSARVLLRQPSADGSGTAGDLTGLADSLADLRARMVALLAERTGRPPGRVAEDLERDRWLSAREALAYGLIDEVGLRRST